MDFYADWNQNPLTSLRGLKGHWETLESVDVTLSAFIPFHLQARKRAHKCDALSGASVDVGAVQVPEATITPNSQAQGFDLARVIKLLTDKEALEGSAILLV